MNLSRPLLFILLVVMSSQAWATKLKGREFQSKILMMRVQEIITYRKQGLELCLKARKGYTTQMHQDFTSELRSYTQGKFRTNQEIVEKALDVLSLTENHSHCSEEINAADAKLKSIQQSKFNVPMKTAKALCVLAVHKSGTCYKNVSAILTQLDPFCVTQNSEDIFGVKDSNACMAGDRLLGKTLRQKYDPDQRLISNFLTSLEAMIGTSKKYATIDLWTLFLKNYADNAYNRKKFLALMAFFYYSLGSAGGYVDGIADHYWSEAFKDGNHPDKVFAEFYSMKQKLDWYRTLIRTKAEPLKIKFTFNKIATEGLNRHDYMAMFLACHFRPYGNINAKIIPDILGFGYESLDMVSHLKEGVSLKNSINNFNRDTGRYTVGSSIGEAFCALKI